MVIDSVGSVEGGPQIIAYSKPCSRTPASSTANLAGRLRRLHDLLERIVPGPEMVEPVTDVIAVLREFQDVLDQEQAIVRDEIAYLRLEIDQLEPLLRIRKQVSTGSEIGN